MQVAAAAYAAAATIYICRVFDLYMSVPAPIGGNRNAISAKSLSVSKPPAYKISILFEISYFFARF